VVNSSGMKRREKSIVSEGVRDLAVSVVGETLMIFDSGKS